jgi:hypothetical protein
MWRDIVVSLAAAFIMMGQAWAIPIDVSTAGLLNCPGGCQAGETGVASRAISVEAGNPGGYFFNDHYSFSLTGPVNADASGFAIDLVPGFNVEDLAFELFGPGMTSLGSFSVPNGTDSTFFASSSFLNLASGAYTLLVSGVIPEAFSGGLYLFEASFANASVSQVPLPPAMWLFLSALAGLYSLAQMRKRSPAVGTSPA